MKVMVALEHRFRRTPDGTIWTTGNLTYDFWTRYLSVFDQLTVVGRVQSAPEAFSGWKMVTGSDVAFHVVPGYQGPGSLVRQLPQVVEAMRSSTAEDSAVILRVPGMVSTLYRRFSMPSGHPFGAEVVGDPWDVYSPGAVAHPLRPLLRYSETLGLKWAVSSASAVAYVSSRQLPERYPAKDGVLTTSYSSIELAPEHFVSSPRLLEARPPKILMVGSLEQRYKGADVLISAMKMAIGKIPTASLTIVGDGRYRHELEDQAKSLGLGEQVHFLGHLPAGDAVRTQLDNATLFVLPSRTEGLPRAMIEAMARGLPCIGTSVGGIPELLPPEDLVPRDDASALAERIVAVLANPERMAEMSARNLATAWKYERRELQARREDFYRAVRDETELWLKSR